KITKMFSDNKGITEMQWHNQESLPHLTTTRYDYEEETEDIRGARIRASGCLIL
ncbi:4173_t:CDS:2, partial [Gigaspora margarita]